ncbi:HAD family hydrolase [Psychrobacillus sp. FSL W7-1457]|uniref:HAD family hydrolase n=1 Tax=unclassified Psychrobacillus TaxID=2636677 RepID=UPI0030FCE0C7
MIQAVIFDLYETLITEWEKGSKKASYSVELLGIEEALYRHEWHARVNDRMDGTYADHPSVLKEILTENGLPIDEKVIQVIHAQRVYVKSVAFEHIDDSIIKMLENLKAKNIKIGLISNCTSEEIEGWYTSLLPPFFDDIVFSYEVKERKPNPGIYLTACKRLGVEPAHCLYIGDGGSDELMGASKVGMNPYQATWFLQSREHNIVFDFPRLGLPREVLDLVKEEEKSYE